MSEFEKITVDDALWKVTDEELSSLSGALPKMLRLIPFIKENPRLYHARLPCFLHGFSYGGKYRLVIGHLLELWEQGYLRDGEFFFYGGSGGFSGSALWGVNIKNGKRIGVRGSYSSLNSATDRVWGIREGRTVVQPPFSGDRAEFSEFLDAVYSVQLEEDDTFPPDVKPHILQDLNSKNVLPDMDFVPIPSGEFLMGYTKTTSYLADKPFLGVQVAVKGFEMLSTPVTIRMWNSITSHCPLEGLRDDSAVYRLKWHECMAFARNLSSIDGEYNYRLPTEAEYEYASKVGLTSEYCYGYEPSEEPKEKNSNEQDLNRIVGNSPPNPWGLYDMGGLVGQWCSNTFQPVFKLKEFYKRYGNGGYRVVKGGVHASIPGFEIPWEASENKYGPGFRLVRTLKQVSL